jgi:hypothetical protein
LETVLTLPKSLRNNHVEVIVLPAPENPDDFSGGNGTGLRGKYKVFFSTEKYFAQKRTDRELE